jgi:hypothetical protein
MNNKNSDDDDDDVIDNHQELLTKSPPPAAAAAAALRPPLLPPPPPHLNKSLGSSCCYDNDNVSDSDIEYTLPTTVAATKSNARRGNTVEGSFASAITAEIETTDESDTSLLSPRGRKMQVLFQQSSFLLNSTRTKTPRSSPSIKTEKSRKHLSKQIMNKLSLSGAALKSSPPSSVASKQQRRSTASTDTAT